MTRVLEKASPGERRTKRGCDAKSVNRGVPYTMRLTNGRTVYIDVPAEMTISDLGGEIAFTPAGMRLLDRVRALVMDTPANPSPAYFATVREALGWSQAQLARRIGKSQRAIARWERGLAHPDERTVKKLSALVRRAAAGGVILRPA